MVCHIFSENSNLGMTNYSGIESHGMCYVGKPEDVRFSKNKREMMLVGP